jgi:hypothetical protein
VSKPRGYALSLAAAALIGTAVAVILSGHLTGRDTRTANGTRAIDHVSPSSPAWHARRRSSWIAGANAVCRLGRKLYPSIAQGANAEPDTMDYAVNRLVNEIAGLPVPTPASARHRQLDRHGQAASSAWRSLATRPIGDVTMRERREAERFAAAYVDELVALGATACAPLRPIAP